MTFEQLKWYTFKTEIFLFINCFSAIHNSKMFREHRSNAQGRGIEQYVLQKERFHVITCSTVGGRSINCVWVCRQSIDRASVFTSVDNRTVTY